MKKHFYIFLSVIITLSLQFSAADTTRRSPSEDGAFSAGPYYNAATSSYFELVRLEGYTWQQASIEAANRKYKDTSGRLAMINRPETHVFIVRNFIFNDNTWIGLRFFCEDSKLEWDGGTSHAGARFANWSPRAELIGVQCPDSGYAATFINSDAFDWNLDSNDGRANLTLIEYPTGRR